MIYLLLCILSSTSIFIVFRLLNRLRVSTVSAIVVNYITAGLLGLIVIGGDGFEPFDAPWFKMAVITGFLFVFMFFVIGYSSRVAGITITSLTTKLSVVIPVLFSILRFGEEITIYKVAGMILALAAIVMIVYKPIKKDGPKSNMREVIWLPVILFFGAGFIDSLIKYSQNQYVSEGETLAFATTTFIVAGITSIGFRLVGRFEKNEDKWYRVLIGGIALGVVNFGSLYFLVMALGSPHIASSVVFGINNIGIVLMSVIAGMVLFGERLSVLNKAGIVTAIISIVILFYS